MHDRRTLLRHAYDSGEKVASIAARFGCAQSTIYKAVGRKRRKLHRPAADLIAKVHTLTHVGLTYLQISRALGLGRHRVLAEMRRARTELSEREKELMLGPELAGVRAENERLREEVARLRAVVESCS